jgi:hypothetical protein
VRNSGCLECEEAIVLLASYPKEEAAEAQSLCEIGSTSREEPAFGPRFAQWICCADERPASFFTETFSFFQLPKSRFSKQKHSGGALFLLIRSNGQASESVQPRSRRPGRTGAARGTHARTSTSTLGRTRQALVSFHPSSREAGKDFVQPRWHTPHQRAPCASELTMKLSCIVVAICSRDAVCLPLPSLAGLATKTPACRRAPPPSASRHPHSTKVNRRV